MKTYVRFLAPLSFAMLIGITAAAQSQSPASSGSPAGPSGGRAAATTAADYRLVPGDKLRIEVYKDAQLSQTLQIRPDGKITLPLVGDLSAAGRTALELRDAIVTSLKDYNSSPALKDSVTVIVTETVPPVFYVMGEVNAPGPQPLHGQVSVLQALAAAGGFKDFAKKNSITIQRKSAAGVTTVKFNYKDAVAGRGQTIYVQPGDTIIVP